MKAQLPADTLLELQEDGRPRVTLLHVETLFGRETLFSVPGRCEALALAMIEAHNARILKAIKWQADGRDCKKVVYQERRFLANVNYHGKKFVTGWDIHEYVDHRGHDVRVALVARDIRVADFNDELVRYVADNPRAPVKSKNELDEVVERSEALLKELQE